MVQKPISRVKAEQQSDSSQRMLATNYAAVRFAKCARYQSVYRAPYVKSTSNDIVKAYCPDRRRRVCWVSLPHRSCHDYALCTNSEIAHHLGVADSPGKRRSCYQSGGTPALRRMCWGRRNRFVAYVVRIRASARAMVMIRLTGCRRIQQRRDLNQLPIRSHSQKSTREQGVDEAYIVSVRPGPRTTGTCLDSQLVSYHWVCETSVTMFSADTVPSKNGRLLHAFRPDRPAPLRSPASSESLELSPPRYFTYNSSLNPAGFNDRH